METHRPASLAEITADNKYSCLKEDAKQGLTSRFFSEIHICAFASVQIQGCTYNSHTHTHTDVSV